MTTNTLIQRTHLSLSQSVKPPLSKKEVVDAMLEVYRQKMQKQEKEQRVLLDALNKQFEMFRDTTLPIMLMKQRGKLLELFDVCFNVKPDAIELMLEDEDYGNRKVCYQWNVTYKQRGEKYGTTVEFPWTELPKEAHLQVVKILKDKNATQAKLREAVDALSPSGMREARSKIVGATKQPAHRVTNVLEDPVARKALERAVEVTFAPKGDKGEALKPAERA